MKFKLLIIIVFFTLSITAQKDIKIVKIDNSDYPNIELLIKNVKSLDTSQLQIFENKQKRDYLISDVPYKEIKKERRILFLLNSAEAGSLKNLLKEEISNLKNADQINVGIMTKGETGKIHIFWLAPEFSRNRQFFTDYFDRINSDFKLRKGKNCKDEKKIQTYLFSANSEFKNAGIIIIGNLENNDLNFCTELEKNAPAPIYVLQTKQIEKEKEDKIIEICMKSGGMYTQSKSNKDGLKILKRYNEDISLVPFNTKTSLEKISFQVSGKNNKTKIKVIYGKYSRSFNITKQKKIFLSDKETSLTVFSSILLLFIIFLLARCRKNRKKTNKQNKKIVELQPANITIPIEINVKGKGLNKTYFFEKHLIRIGRNTENDIVIPDTTVSGNHAIINKQGKEFVIQDLGSTNGVVVNQKKTKKKTLKTGDKIKLGGIVMFVRF